MIGFKNYRKENFDYACILSKITDTKLTKALKHMQKLHKGIATNSQDTDTIKNGLSVDPHITIFYGLYDSVDKNKLNEIIGYNKNLKLTCKNINWFSLDTHDVLHFECESDSLSKLHYQLSQFPNGNTFPMYKPHITIAHIKKDYKIRYALNRMIQDCEMPFDINIDNLYLTLSNNTEIKLV